VRKIIINAVKDVLEESELFKNIYLSPTLIEKERSFPVAWINLGNEYFNPSAVDNKNFYRKLDLEIILGQKQDRGKDNMNPLLDTVFDIFESNYTINGTVINCTPIRITTDDGYLYPYAISSINYELLVR